MDDRDELMLMERVGRHRTLCELSDEHRLTPEGVRRALRRAAHEHISGIVAAMWEAQRDGEILMLAVPAGFEDDQAAALAYFEWVVREMSRLWGIEPRVHYRPAVDGGFAFFLEDPAMPGAER